MGSCLCKTGEVNQGQVQDVGRKNLEVDGLAVYALVGARHSCGLILDLTLDVFKVCEAPVWDVMELGPLIPSSLPRDAITGRRVIFSVVFRDVDKLQDKGSASDDAGAAGQEVSPDDVLQHRGLACGLGTDNNLQGVYNISIDRRKDVCLRRASWWEPGIQSAGDLTSHFRWC